MMMSTLHSRKLLVFGQKFKIYRDLSEDLSPDITQQKMEAREYDNSKRQQKLNKERKK